MKRVIFSFILIGTILAGGVLAYAIWKATPVTSEQFLESGRKFYEQKKYSEATVQLLNAIQKDPKNRDARYLLVLSYMAQKNLTAGVNQLNALLEYFPDDVEANLQLGTIYLSAGRTDANFFGQAGKIAQKILSKDSQNVAALILSGNASAGLQDYHSSAELFEKALALDPQNTAAFVSLGTVETLQKNYPEAEQAFLKARQVNPKDKSAMISLANYYHALREDDKAEVVFKEALSSYPSDKEIYLPMAQFFYQSERFDEAEKVLKDAQTRNAEDPTPSLLLADFYLARSRRPDAKKLLLEIKQKFPANIDVATMIAVTLLQSDPDQARPEIDQILKSQPKNPIGPILQGELQFFTGKYQEAEATLGKDPAINSGYPEPHFFLGNIAERKGQIEKAQEHYQKSLEVNGAYLPARTALAEVFLNKGRLTDSREEIRKVLAVQPNFVSARLIQATLDTAEKKYSEAENQLMALVKEQPDNPLIHQRLAFYYETRGRSGDAEKSLLRALELQPNSEETLQQLTTFYIQEKQPDRAIQKINAVPEDKKQALHYELLGLANFQANRLEESEKAYKKAIEKDPNRVSSYVLLVGQYMQSGRTEDGLQELALLLKKDPNNAFAYATQGQFHQNQGKMDEAKKDLAEALKIDPNYDPIANNLAYILADEGHELNNALTWAQMARKKKPENPSYADTLGWVYYKLGNLLLARDQLQFATSHQPDNAVFQYHLAMIYKDNRQIAEAQTALKKALRSQQPFKEKPLAEAALKEITNLK
jgi:tetratricopeptide (TPR) repeat protein